MKQKCQIRLGGDVRKNQGRIRWGSPTYWGFRNGLIEERSIGCPALAILRTQTVKFNMNPVVMFFAGRPKFFEI